MSDKYLRQLDIVDPELLQVPITIIGAGGIGSWATLALAKLGCQNITVIDNDAVEEHNSPSQLYSTDDLQQEKVFCLDAHVERLTGSNIRAIESLFEEYADSPEYSNPNILIIGVDSLEARRSIWSKLSQLSEKPQWIIDTRMGGEVVRVITFAMEDEKRRSNYETHLFDTNKKPHEEPCTARAVAYNTFFCGGLIANTVKRIVKGEDIKSDLILDISNLELI